MRRRNVIVNGALVVGILVIGGVGYATIRNPSSAATTLRTTTVRSGTVTATVAGSGNVTSAVNRNLSFSSCTGDLTAVKVTAGQKVRKGQELAKVDPTDAETAVSKAKTALSAARENAADAKTAADTKVSDANSSYSIDVGQAQDSVTAAEKALTNAENTVDTDRDAVLAAQAKGDARAVSTAKATYFKAKSARTQARTALTNAQRQLSNTKTKDQQSVTAAETSRTQTESAYSQANASVTSAEAALVTAEDDLAGCTLTAPAAGTVTVVNGAVGNTPGSTSASTSSTATTSSAGSSSASSGSTFISMVDMSKLVIDTDFSESDIAALKVGQPATVVFAALPTAANPAGTTVTGKVTSIDPTSTVTNNVVNYGVQIALIDPPAALRLGQTGTVTVVTATKTNVLYVVTTAITTTGVGKTVTVQKGGTTSVVPVQTGVTGDSTTEIISGLSAGETVVLPTTTSTSTGNGGIPGVGGGFGGAGVGGGR